MEQQYNDLNHTGVPGMRWGHRKAERKVEKLAKQIGSANSKANAHKTEAEKAANAERETLKTYQRRAKELEKAGKYTKADLYKSRVENSKQNLKDIDTTSKKAQEAYARKAAKKEVKLKTMLDKYGNDESKKVIKQTIKKHSNKKVSLLLTDYESMTSNRQRRDAISSVMEKVGVTSDDLWVF